MAAFAIGALVVAAFVAVMFGIFALVGPGPVLGVGILGGLGVLAYAVGRNVLDAIATRRLS